VTDAAHLCRAAQKVNKNIALQYNGSGPRAITRNVTTIMPNSADTLTN